MRFFGTSPEMFTRRIKKGAALEVREVEWGLWGTSTKHECEWKGSPRLSSFNIFLLSNVGFQCASNTNSIDFYLFRFSGRWCLGVQRHNLASNWMVKQKFKRSCHLGDKFTYDEHEVVLRPMTQLEEHLSEFTVSHYINSTKVKFALQKDTKRSFKTAALPSLSFFFLRATCYSLREEVHQS